MTPAAACLLLALALPAGQARAMLEDVLSNRRYQRELVEERLFQPPPVLDVGHVLLLCLAGLVLAVIVWLSISTVQARRQAAIGSGGAAAGSGPSAGFDRSQADALAAAGRYGEAIHLLLLGALEHVKRGRSGIRDSWTAREVLHRARIGDAQRGALQLMVAVVEHHLFGGRSVGAADYERCARAADRLLGAEAASA